jgi:uncharacterized protein (TIGR01777 family)
MNLQRSSNRRILQKIERVKSGSAIKSPFTPFIVQNIVENRTKSKERETADSPATGITHEISLTTSWKKNSQMKTIIAGATGLIGRRLTTSLLASGHSVTLLTTRAVDGRSDERTNFSIVRWDGESEGVWTEYLDEADAVINLSGHSLSSGRWTPERKKILVESRLKSTRAIVQAMRSTAQKPGTFINASAVGYYGPVESDVVSEKYPAGNDFLAQLCRRWEEEASVAASFGVRVVQIRSGVVLDQDGGVLKRFILPFSLFVGGPLGTGAQWFPWIHCDDESNAITFALQNPHLSGPVNLVSPKPVTMRDFARTLGKVLHRPSILKVPAFVLRVALGEMADMVLTGQRVIPEKLLEAGFEFTHPDLEEALSHLLT